MALTYVLPALDLRGARQVHDSLQGYSVPMQKNVLRKAWLPCLAMLFSACAHGSLPPGNALISDLNPDPPESWGNDVQTFPDSDLDQKWMQSEEYEKVSQLVEEAVAHNPDLQAARARVLQSQAAAKISGAARLPNLQANLNGNRSDTRTRSDAGTISSQAQTQFDLSATLSWEVDVWGRVKARHGAGLADYQGAKADFAAAKLSTATRTVVTWSAAINATAQRGIAEETVTALLRTTDIARRRYQRGLGTILEVRLAERDLANGKADLENRLNQEKSAKRALERILGRYPSGVISVSETLPNLSLFVPEEQPSALLGLRPDVRAAYVRIRAAAWRLGEAKASRLPVFNLTGSLTSSDGNFTDLLNPGRLVASIIGNAVIPLFDNGQRKAEVDQNLARMDEQSSNYVVTVLNAYEETQNLLSAAMHLKAQQENFEVSLDRALRSEELSERQYRIGLTTLSDLLQSQRTRFQIQSQLSDIKQQRIANRANLHLAFGGSITNLAEGENIYLKTAPNQCD